MSNMSTPDLKDGSELRRLAPCEPTTSDYWISQGPTADSWERLRPIIRTLYIDEDRTLRDVMSIMAGVYGHKAT